MSARVEVPAGRRRWALALAGACILLATQATPSTAAQTTAGDPWEVALEGIREDLVQLRLEKVLSDTDALLREARLPEAAREGALVLRSQAHVALGDLEAAGEDFEEILRLRPAWEPDASLTTPEARRRFDAVRKRIVATVRIEIVPQDAVVTLPDRSDRIVTADSEGLFRLVAGSRVLRVARPGYDSWQETLDLEAGKETALRVQLVPNARTVTFATSVEDVAILIDGREVGRTAFPERAPVPGRPAVAKLTVPYIPLGEHEFAYVRPCFRTVRRTRMLNIDVLDPAPLTLPVLEMEPARAPLVVTGRPPGGTVRVDGEAVGRVPTESASVCPGERTIEVRVDDRVVYLERVSAVEGVAVRLEVSPRPNVAMVGGDGWPVGFEAARASASVLATVEAPSGVDLSTADGWRAVGLDRDVDLALAILPPAGPVTGERRYLYSPLLGTVERLDSVTAAVGRPAWQVNAVGVTVVDTAVGGRARVAAIDPGGPAAAAGLRVGDRLLEVDGETLASGDAFRRRVDAAPVGSTLGLRVEGADGKIREFPIEARPSPRLVRAADEPGAAAWLAAWARRWSVAFPADSATALAVLGGALERAGRTEAAVEAWRRVRWEDRPGIGPGTAAYHLGRLLLGLGRESEAIDAFRAAASSGATDVDDDGPRVAPAALDHLADLGVRIDGDPFTTR